jgi:phage terminase large subunit GpA-like protein
VPADPVRGFGEEWIAQLDSEVRLTKYRVGQPITLWAKRSTHFRNEALDLLVMALILSESLHLLPERAPNYRKAPVPGASEEEKKPSRWGAQLTRKFHHESKKVAKPFV